MAIGMLCSKLRLPMSGFAIKALLCLAFLGQMLWVSPAAVGQDSESVQRMPLVVGGDLLTVGPTALIGEAVDNAAFLLGSEVGTLSDVVSSVYAAGSIVRVEQAVGGSVYAAGYGIDISGDVAGDVSVMGSRVTVTGRVGRNLRSLVDSLDMSGQVGGSLLFAGRRLALAGTIDGDLHFRGAEIAFEPGARVIGRIFVPADFAQSIPVEVADPSRISRYDAPAVVEQRSPVAGYIIWLGVLVIIGLIWVWVFPRRNQKAIAVLEHSTWQILLRGAAGFSMALGLPFFLGLSIVLAPLLPFALALLALIWVAGIVLGGYFLLLRLWSGLGRAAPARGGQSLAVLAGAVMAVAIGMIPFMIGWILTFAFVVYAIGVVLGTVRRPSQG